MASNIVSYGDDLVKEVPMVSTFVVRWKVERFFYWVVLFHTFILVKIVIKLLTGVNIYTHCIYLINNLSIHGI
jgi:hypothetical protein